MLRVKQGSPKAIDGGKGTYIENGALHYNMFFRIAIPLLSFGRQLLGQLRIAKAHNCCSLKSLYVLVYDFVRLEVKFRPIFGGISLLTIFDPVTQSPNMMSCVIRAGLHWTAWLSLGSAFLPTYLQTNKVINGEC